MLRGYVLRYLARVATGASFEEACASVPALLRALVVRRAQRATIAAGFDTEHASDVAHVHRLAYLHLVGARMIDASDVEGTLRTFESKRDASAERRAFVRVALTLIALIALSGGGLGAWMLLRETKSTPTPATRAAHDALDEALEEREPAHPLDALFRHTLPDYVVALDAASANREPPPPDDVASQRARVLAELERERPALVPSMTGLLDAAEHYATGAGDDDVGRWFNQLVLFHDALAGEDVPFFVDAELQAFANGRQRVLLSTYRVLARREFLAGDQRVRCLDLERLDTLNFERSLLGYTRPEVRYALVLVDRIERMLVEDLLPSVHAANESVIVRGYEDEVGTEWVTSFEGWAHEDLREEAQHVIAEALGDTRALEPLAAAIVARRNAITELNQSLRANGVQLREPRTYDYDLDRLTDLGARGPALGNVRRAEASLHTQGVLAAYRALHSALALSIAEHEVQHRLDYEMGRAATVPEVLRRYTGETVSEDRVNRRAERSNAELSAYLSQIAQRPSLARTSLVHVASFVMNRHSWGMPESYAAVALLETLADEAGIAHADLIQRHRIVRAEAARIYGELRARGPAAISELAARGWTRLYGAELPPIRELN